MLYRIKAGSREYYLVRASDEAVIKIARAKVWEIAPGEKISVFRGEVLIGETNRLSLFDDQ